MGLSASFREHNLKIQGDYFYLTKDDGTDGDRFDDGEHQGRVQMQLFF